MRREPTSNQTLLAGFIALSAAVLILTIGFAWGFVKLTHTAASETQLDHSLIEACQRGNILRIQNNVSYYADFVVFSFVNKRFLIPTKTETPAQKAITNEFAAKLRDAVRKETWTAPTDCTKAINEKGVAYRAPRPVPFYKRLPPKSALR